MIAIRSILYHNFYHKSAVVKKMVNNFVTLKAATQDPAMHALILYQDSLIVMWVICQAQEQLIAN